MIDRRSQLVDKNRVELRKTTRLACLSIITKQFHNIILTPHLVKQPQVSVHANSFSSAELHNF